MLSSKGLEMADEDKLGFREWTSHYEKEQEADRDKINSIVETVSTLSGVVNRMSASVEALTENQRGMFSRMNRPWQWGVVIAGFTAMLSMSAIMSIMLNLTIDPIKDSMRHVETQYQLDVARNLELHIWFKETQEEVQKDIARVRTHVEWLSKMEERMNNRLHLGVQ